MVEFHMKVRPWSIGGDDCRLIHAWTLRARSVGVEPFGLADAMDGDAVIAIAGTRLGMVRSDAAIGRAISVAARMPLRRSTRVLLVLRFAGAVSLAASRRSGRAALERATEVLGHRPELLILHGTRRARIAAIARGIVRSSARSAPLAGVAS